MQRFSKQVKFPRNVTRASSRRTGEDTAGRAAFKDPRRGRRSQIKCPFVRTAHEAKKNGAKRHSFFKETTHILKLSGDDFTFNLKLLSSERNELIFWRNRLTRRRAAKEPVGLLPLHLPTTTLNMEAVKYSKS